MKNQIFDFNSIATGKPVKAIQQAFARAGVPVISIDADGKAKRTAGVSYKALTLTFADSQKVELAIKQSGDVYRVSLNGSVVPLKNPDDHAKAVGEIAKMLDAGRAKFQAKMARTKVDLPKGIKTAAPKMEQQLAAQIQELDTKIAERRATLEELKAAKPVMDAAQHEGDGEVDEPEQDDDKQGKLLANKDGDDQEADKKPEPDGDEESDDDDDDDDDDDGDDGEQVMDGVKQRGPDPKALAKIDEIAKLDGAPDPVANVGHFLMAMTGKTNGTWEGRLPAEYQRKLLGRVIGKGIIAINGEDDTVSNLVSVGFGADYDYRNVTPFRKLALDSVGRAMDAVGSYKINHQTFSAACTEAIRMAEGRRFTVDDDDWFSKVSSGPRKPQPLHHDSILCISFVMPLDAAPYSAAAAPFQLIAARLAAVQFRCPVRRAYQPAFSSGKKFASCII